MKPHRSKTAIVSGNKSIATEILEDWLDASTNFYVYYNQLIACVSQSIHTVSSYQQPTFIGQCPLDRLVSIVIDMQAELEVLVKEMKELDKKESKGRSSSSTAKKELKLAKHTRRLNKLNQHASTRLWLAGLSPS
ncbi:hypothetical protein [Fibrisoma limi]|uniref:hypothetical protein n=1 Tax=Fibrisoma limi TaxID=663275 RepID=UPI0005880636|nr:hypothetical protein [Fibrisoma limi]